MPIWGEQANYLWLEREMWILSFGGELIGLQPDLGPEEVLLWASQGFRHESLGRRPDAKWLMPHSGQARSHQSTHAACSQSRVTGRHVSGVTIPVMGIPAA